MNEIVVIRLADDISSTFASLKNEGNPTVILKSLAEIIIFIRTHPQVRGKQTESISGIESSIIDFLNGYRGENFEEIYSLVREVIRHIPKFHVFDVDITALRDIAHDFHDAYRNDEVFGTFAADIRVMVHQHLSDRVVHRIEALENFLYSDTPSIQIDGSTIRGATRADKDTLLNSEIFQDILVLKEKLKIAWANKSDNVKAVYSQEEFADVIEVVIRKLPMDEIRSMPSYPLFMNYFHESLDMIRQSKWKHLPMGISRYQLKKLIEEVIASELPHKGDTLFRLMTIDSLMEQISFLYYANIVNSSLTEITDRNYNYSLEILFNLALCTRAIGHGTKHLGRFAFLIEKLWKQNQAENIPSIIDAMNFELKKNLTFLQDIYSERLKRDDRFHQVNKLMNNIIREKTTHILGNLINNFTNYEILKRSERFSRVMDHIPAAQDIHIRDLTFHFGTDIDISREYSGKDEFKLCPEFMGGKGYSQAANSRIILENSLVHMDVPRGGGFSTLTWYYLRKDPRLMDDFRNELWNLIRNIEMRSGRIFGDSNYPLLLIARSGATVSLPGILDTISHIGINRRIAESWSRRLAEPRRAYQAYINFLLSYSRSVLSLDTKKIIKFAGYEKNEILFKQDFDGLQAAAGDILFEIRLQSGMGEEAVPEEPFEQLYNATLAVFRSYEDEVVQVQARNYNMPEQFQTACLIQECMPILLSKDCSGVFFTRDPNTGTGEHKFSGQIEYREGFFGDVIADGSVSPETMKKFIKKHKGQYESLKKFKYFDERQQKSPTDIEFAVRAGTTYIVQSRILKQSPIASIKNSYDLYREGVINEYELLKRTAFSINRNISHTYLDHSFLDRKNIRNVPVIARGKPVNGGVVSGRIIQDHNSIGVFDGPLIFLTENNVPPIVIMKEDRFRGYISKEGGMTSHAALVAIGERKPCVVDVDWKAGREEGEIILGGTRISEGEIVTLDANTGNIYRNEIPVIEVNVVDEDFVRIQREILEVMDQMISFEKIS